MSKQKTTSVAELRKKSEKELLNLLHGTLESMQKDLSELASGKAKNTNIASKSRKLVARVKTVLKEKKILAEIKS